MLHHPFTD
jgi:ATP-dependent DNA helicase PIF1